MANQLKGKNSEEKGRIHVEDLPQQEKELKEGEAKNIKGSGRFKGGKVGSADTIGEEIPS